MARVARLQDTKINLRDEKGKEHTFRKPASKVRADELVEKAWATTGRHLRNSMRDLTLDSKPDKLSVGVKKDKHKLKKVESKRKDSDMEKTIKAQKFAALVVLAAGCVFGITQYTNDVAVIVGGVVLVALLLEKAK